MTSQWPSELEAYLWPGGFKRDIWLIADAARDPRILAMLRECHLEHHCLYRGALSPELEMAAPYLVQLECDDQGTRRLLRSAWGNSWGVFLKCAAHAQTLRRHLREFLVVRDSTANRLVFRYYDPRVLRVYLPTCTPEELRTFFGPIECFWLEDGTSNFILNYSRDKTGLAERKQSLKSASSTTLP
jgi:uncharacterized protein DUF4123